jgi:hypothetical protein
MYYNWRPRTVELLQLATGHRDRFDRAYVAGLIKERLAAFLRPGPEEEMETRRLGPLLEKLADRAVRADSLMQSTPLEWQFFFGEPETGMTSGFAYRASTTWPRDRNDRMRVHTDQSSNNEWAIGRPVDHVVQPLVQAYALNPNTGQWKLPHAKSPMTVVVDMFVEDVEDEVEEGAAPPKGENEGENGGEAEGGGQREQGVV